MPHSNSGSDAPADAPTDVPASGEVPAPAGVPARPESTAASPTSPSAILGRTPRAPLAAPAAANRTVASGEGQAASGEGQVASGEGQVASGEGQVASGEGQAGDASRSTHALRVSGGQVVEAESGGDEFREGNGGKGVHEVRLPPIDVSLPLEARPAEAMRLAQEAFNQTGYWVSFYRAILGVEGAVFKLFPTAEEMAFFEETSEFAEIHTMLTALRASDLEKIDAVEPQTMITIRMPRSLRAVLVEEAKPLNVSINKLCISKLLLPINPRFVPPERGRVRGRKPGEQSRSNRGKKDAKARKEG
ncbi:hypothetical protein [Candidatus Laterigemmans baculatus]|uniref:hypothetical protein n=1 Tax=Candidatus Laterigemmans baculatus TaxID=2770505 RepID=UPI0013DCB7AF|nr:hypothetical protein [Candidatus Laterigemmans baculatus]